VIEADLVVIGIGVRPLIDLAEQADIGHVDERVTLYCKTLPYYPQSFIRSGFSNPHLPQRMVALLSLRSDA
jgi:meiotically up-regulated gene 157 (Mug157) protein